MLENTIILSHIITRYSIGLLHHCATRSDKIMVNLAFGTTAKEYSLKWYVKIFKVPREYTLVASRIVEAVMPQSPIASHVLPLAT